MNFKSIIIALCIFNIIGVFTIFKYRNSIEKLNIEIANIEQSIDIKISKIQKSISDQKRIKIIKATITAYSPHIEQTDDSPYTTAFLKKVDPKYVACSRTILYDLKWPVGSKIYIEGVGIRIIGDLMNKRFKDNRFDLFMWKKEDAIKYGIKKNINVILLDTL